MTVKELIQRLEKMPPDAPVVIDMMSDCYLLDDDEPKLEKMVLYNNSYMEFGSHIVRCWDEAKRGPMVPVEVCHFPGN